MKLVNRSTARLTAKVQVYVTGIGGVAQAHHSSDTAQRGYQFMVKTKFL